MKYFAIGIVTMSMVQCTTPKGMDQTKLQPIVELRTTGCFGNCPVYLLQLFPNRDMVFKGENNIDRIGTYQKSVSERQYQYVIDAFDRLDFAHMKAVYDGPVSDLSTTYITFRPAFGKEKTVKARFDYPAELTELITMLKNLATNREGWILVKSDSTAGIVRDHLIIHLQPTVGLDRFMATYVEQGLVMVRTISEEDNLHLFSFDTVQVDPDAFLQQIRHDERVIHAEFDHKLELRR